MGAGASANPYTELTILYAENKMTEEVETEFNALKMALAENHNNRTKLIKDMTIFSEKYETDNSHHKKVTEQFESDVANYNKGILAFEDMKQIMDRTRTELIACDLKYAEHNETQEKFENMIRSLDVELEKYKICLDKLYEQISL